MRKAIYIFALVGILLSTAQACSETMDAPSAADFKTYENTVPSYMRSNAILRNIIHSGITPPNITGTYLVSPNLFFYSPSGIPANNIMMDFRFKVFAQDGNVLSFTAQEIGADGKVVSTIKSSKACIMGSGNQFTVYAACEIEAASSSNWRDLLIRQLAGMITQSQNSYPIIFVLSGELCREGIHYLNFATMQTATGNENSNLSTLALFQDQDGLAVFD